MSIQQPTYTAFFKLFPISDNARREAAESRIANFVSEYRAERISSFGYSFFDDPAHVLKLWATLKRTAHDGCHMVLIRHETLGIGSLPADLAPQIIGLPRESLATLQQEVETILERIP